MLLVDQQTAREPPQRLVGGVAEQLLGLRAPQRDPPAVVQHHCGQAQHVQQPARGRRARTRPADLDPECIGRTHPGTLPLTGTAASPYRPDPRLRSPLARLPPSHRPSKPAAGRLTATRRLPGTSQSVTEGPAAVMRSQTPSMTCVGAERGALALSSPSPCFPRARYLAVSWPHQPPRRPRCAGAATVAAASAWSTGPHGGEGPPGLAGGPCHIVLQRDAGAEGAVTLPRPVPAVLGSSSRSARWPKTRPKEAHNVA